MKYILIKIPESKNRFKETEEERKERLKYINCTRTKVKESKKIYSRKNIYKDFAQYI